MWGRDLFCEREKEYYIINILLSMLLGGFSLHAGFILIDKKIAPDRVNSLSIILLLMDITSSYKSLPLNNYHQHQ